MCVERLDIWINQRQIFEKGVCPLFHLDKWINGYFDQPVN